MLAGQPELGVRLEEPELRQLKQRVALRCEIAPFDLSESAAYIASRIQSVGGVPFRLFTREAVVLIHERSKGIPRTINVICDNALMSGMAMDRQIVDEALVLEVCKDFALRNPDPPRQDDEPVVEPIMTPLNRGIGQAGGPTTGGPPTPGGRDGAAGGLDQGRRPRRFSVFGSGLW